MNASPAQAEKTRDKKDRLAIGFVMAALTLMAVIVAMNAGRTPAAPGFTGTPENDHSHLRRKAAPLSREDARRAGIVLREAMYWEALEGGRVRCELCPFACELADGERGACKVRANYGGKLYTLVYGRLVSMAAGDPIEKKPLYQFLPGTITFSIATAGCNLGCKFCQNWTISQSYPEAADLRYSQVEPNEVVTAAKAYGCDSIAYTYNEPAVFYEFVLDCAKLAKKAGLKNVLVTSGYINPKPLRELAKYIDGANVDLKGPDEFYQEYCIGRLDPVLVTLKILKEEGVYCEITNLLIPTANDNEAWLREMCTWIKDNLGADCPLHFSRHFPRYKLKQLPETPRPALARAREIAIEAGLRQVYVGNVYDREGKWSTTYCPECGKPLIRRVGYTIEFNKVEGGKCAYCGAEIRGVWE
jgi:pyruvate formate lyase activating enzyme